MHVEALQWLNCILTRTLQANCHQLYELGNEQQNMLAGSASCSALSSLRVQTLMLPDAQKSPSLGPP